MSSNTLTKIQLSVQRALIGMIPPAVYAVSATLENSHITLYFYTENLLSEEAEEDLSCIETEVIADFGTPFSIATEIRHVPKKDFSAGHEIMIFLQKFDV